MPPAPKQKNQVTTVKGNKKVTPRYTKQATLQYKTFLKRAFSEALQNAFDGHPDKSLAKTKIGIEYRTDRTDFPQIVVKFYEKSINNIGVGHEEWLPSESDPMWPTGPFTKFIKYYHRLYKGDIEFEIWALSSVDRDKVADALIETIAMADVSPEGSHFQDRLYNSLETPYAKWHFLAINSDLINGYGEQQSPVPWFAEDVLGYQTSYRVPIMGEFYSLTPPPPAGGTGLVEEVDIYGWDEAVPMPVGPNQVWPDTPPEDFPEGIIPDEDYIKIHKRNKVIPEGEEADHGLETSTTLETNETLETDA